jgi:hypothetical protein
MTIDELNALHGTSFRSDGPYVGGEVGAERLLDGDGRAFALKRQPPGNAVRITERLRERGYPVPRYVVVGATYSVQEELPGAPLGAWDVPFPPRLLELVDLQQGCAVDADRTWPATIVESVTDGFEEFMVLETLKRHSDEGRELLARCRSAVERHAHRLTTTDDIAHMDCTADNVLAVDGAITGVIDWGGARSGDRAFDLATWSYYAPSDAALRATVIERIGEKGFSVYLSHLAIRQADWSIRHHGEEAGWQTVRYGLQLARAFPA